MAIEVPLLDLAFKANADFSTNQFFLVKLDTTANSTVGTCSATTDTILGILQNKPGSLQAASVRIMGVSKCVASGSISAGSFVTTDATGRAAAQGLGSTSTYQVGVALDQVTALGQVVSVLLTHPGRGA